MEDITTDSNISDVSPAHIEPKIAIIPPAPKPRILVIDDDDIEGYYLTYLMSYIQDLEDKVRVAESKVEIPIKTYNIEYFPTETTMIKERKKDTRNWKTKNY